MSLNICFPELLEEFPKWLKNHVWISHGKRVGIVWVIEVLLYWCLIRPFLKPCDLPLFSILLWFWLFFDVFSTIVYDINLVGSF